MRDTSPRGSVRWRGVSPARGQHVSECMEAAIAGSFRITRAYPQKQDRHLRRDNPLKIFQVPRSHCWGLGTSSVAEAGTVPAVG